jgi:hypothetical protein
VGRKHLLMLTPVVVVVQTTGGSSAPHLTPDEFTLHPHLGGHGWLELCQIGTTRIAINIVKSRFASIVQIASQLAKHHILGLIRHLILVRNIAVRSQVGVEARDRYCGATEGCSRLSLPGTRSEFPKLCCYYRPFAPGRGASIPSRSCVTS